jgi:putative sigma-54 modulation protein
MEINLTGRHLKITPAIRGYVSEKVEKAQKYFDHIVRAQVVLFIEKRSHKAEIVIHAPRQMFRALASAVDLYSAIDLASDKIDAQLKKHKEKLKDHHKTKETKEDAAPEIDGIMGAAAAAFSVVKRPVKPISAADAAAEMESLGHNFLLYQDKDAGQLQVVFRRSDESYGIVQPVRKGK